MSSICWVTISYFYALVGQKLHHLAVIHTPVFTAIFIYDTIFHMRLIIFVLLTGLFGFGAYLFFPKEFFSFPFEIERVHHFLGFIFRKASLSIVLGLICAWFSWKVIHELLGRP